jgi:hypothetical protein
MNFGLGGVLLRLRMYLRRIGELVDLTAYLSSSDHIDIDLRTNSVQ